MKMKKKDEDELYEGLAKAARNGHEDIVRLCKEWGATDFDWMMSSAAEGGHKDIVKLFKEWGATKFLIGRCQMLHTVDMKT